MNVPAIQRQDGADGLLDELFDPEFEALLAEDGLTDERPADVAELDAWVDVRLAALKGIERRIGRNDRAAQLRIQMVENWRDAQNAVLERQREHLTALLEQVARTYPYPKGKSRTLSAGKIGVKDVPEKLKVEDKDAALEFARARDGLAEAIVEKVTYSIAQRELKAYYDSTGELPDGCAVEPKIENVPYVKVG